MIKAVFDTNIYLSAIIFGGKPRKIFLAAARGKIILFISKEILAELRGVLRKKFGYPLWELDKIEQTILEVTEIVEPRKTVKIIPSEPMDDHILACALEAKASFLVSGDKKHLLPLKKFRNIPIVSAAQFLKILKKNGHQSNHVLDLKV